MRSPVVSARRVAGRRSSRAPWRCPTCSARTRSCSCCSRARTFVAIASKTRASRPTASPRRATAPSDPDRYVPASTRRRGGGDRLGGLDEGPLPVARALLRDARLHARLEQHRIEGLRQEILGALLDAAHRARHVVERRDHDHRDVARRAVPLEAREHREAIHLRHHDVEQHEVGRLRLHHRERLLPVLGAAHQRALASRGGA